MSVLLPKERSYYFSTSNLGKDTILSNDKSRLSISLDTAISVSSGALYASLSVQSALLWHTSPNISTKSLNNTFDYLIGGVAQPTIVIQDGLYSLSGLGGFLSKEFQKRGQNADLITFTGDDATQTVIMSFKANVQFDTSGLFTVAPILGFAKGALYPPTPQSTDDYPVYGTNQAAFNTVNAFSIVSDIVSNGIPVNNSGVNLLAVIPIPSGSVGRQVVYTPYLPTEIDATNDLRGKRRSTFYIQIADQDGNPLPQTENWSVLVTLKEQLLLTNEQLPMLDV